MEFVSKITDPGCNSLKKSFGSAIRFYPVSLRREVFASVRQPVSPRIKPIKETLFFHSFSPIFALLFITL
jgi:hypothetical protein